MKNHLDHIHRDINGVILMDKPSGLSSNKLLQIVKQLFCANKAGHTGALDPLATGMLPICFGKATKFSQYLLNADKYYRVIAKLGERTDTSDADGQIVSIRPVVLKKEDLESELDYFFGKTYQVPSMFSAIKHKGRPLYEYARKGILVPRKSRLIQIYSLQLLWWNHDQIELDIHCSKGTYIRTMIDDLGERLGCGAHVKSLRRLAIFPYSNTRMITLKALQILTSIEPKSQETLNRLDTLLLPIETVVKDILF